jgi:hypothetical protein
MLTRSLFKHFLSFSLFALLLLPQISGSGSALAKKRPTATPTPRPVTHTRKFVVKLTPSRKDAANPICLNVSNSTAFGGVHPAINPPGQQVEAGVALSVTNLCTANNPVSNITISGTLNTTCATGALPDKPVPIIFPARGALDNGGTDGGSGLATSRCIISANDVPISSVLPVSVTINITANGVSTSGQLVSAPPYTINVIW